MRSRNARNLAATKYETVVKPCLFFGYNFRAHYKYQQPFLYWKRIIRLDELGQGFIIRLIMRL